MDTQNKRASALMVTLSFGRVFPVPDSSLDSEGDRQQMNMSYRFADDVVGPTPDHSYQHNGHGVGITGMRRTWSN